MRRKYKGIRLLLTAAMVVSINAAPAAALASSEVNMIEEFDSERPELTSDGNFKVDETIYITMDHYGNTQSMSIVKGVTPYMNDKQQFIDYGHYSSVTNMSADFTPIITEDELTWDLPAGIEKFYFEATMSQTCFAVPWDITVTYALNGMPVDPATLAGAQGLIEIRVQGEPNNLVTDYFKNNMALELIYIPEEEHTKQLSVDGGMVQTIGSIQVAAYSVLPDNEFDATFEIVSDSYESSGLQMILQPVTLDMLDMVQEFKDARNNMRDSSNRIYEGLDAAMAAFVGMDDGLAELQTAMSKYGSAQDSVSVHSDDLDNAMDLTREQLKQLAVATEAIRPHISNAKITVSDISEELNQLNGTLGELQPEIDDLRDLLFDIDDDIKEIQDYLEDAGDNNADLKASLSSLGSNLNVLRKTTAAMSLSALRTDTGRLTDDLEELEVNLGQMASSQGFTVESAMLIQALAPSLGSTIDLIDDSTDLVGGAEVLIEASNELNASLGDLARDLGHTVDVLDDGMELASDNLNAFHDMSDQVLDILDTSSTMLDDIDSLLTFIIEQERQVQPALDDMDNLIGASTELLDSFSGNLEILDQISDGSRDNLEQGTDHLIAGSQNVLVNARDMTDSAAIIRSASADFKAELDKEEEVLDEDLAFLYNMDPDALKVSFTAERNSEPNTLQVMMRTEEITIDEDEEEVQRLDLEQVEQSSLWDRISKLFASLVLSVKNVIQRIKG